MQIKKIQRRICLKILIRRNLNYFFLVNMLSLWVHAPDSQFKAYTFDYISQNKDELQPKQEHNGAKPPKSHKQFV